MEVGRILEEAGVDVSFNTDDYILDSRLFLRYAALNVRYGMSESGALEALTLAGARALRLEARVGSLEPGKDADFVVLSGPPFSLYTRVLETWVEGERIFDFENPEHHRYAVGGEDTYRLFLITQERADEGHDHAGVPARAARAPGRADLRRRRRGDIAVRGGLIYTMDGEPIENGVVIVRDGRINRVGPADRVRIPDGMTVLEAAVVTPGFVDAHSTVGLSGIYGGRAGQVRDQDQLESSEPVQPELRPVDAYNAADPLIEWIRQFGVTTIHTGHGPGAVVSGRTMVVKTRGRTVEEALVADDVAVAITLGPSVSDNFESPGTRAKTVALLRAALVEAADYAAKRRATSHHCGISRTKCWRASSTARSRP